MKRLFRKTIKITAPLALLLSTASCIYEGLHECPDKFAFAIENNWEAMPGANPEGMAYIFFPRDDSEPWRFDFPGLKAGHVKMNTGAYQFISHNDDTYAVLFRNTETYETYEAFTAETNPLSSIPASERGKVFPEGRGERTAECPDMMCGCAYYDFSLEYDGLSYVASPVAESENGRVFSPEFILTANQKLLTPLYSFRIEKIKNFEGVRTMSASLSGMAGSMVISSGKKGAYPSTLVFKAMAIDPTTAGGCFYTFGIPFVPIVKNVLSLYVVLKDGRRFCYEFDVTDQVRYAPNPMDVHLIIRGLTLEIPHPGDGTAFDVNVDGWETVVVNIKG